MNCKRRCKFGTRWGNKRPKIDDEGKGGGDANKEGEGAKKGGSNIKKGTWIWEYEHEMESTMLEALRYRMS